MGRFGTISIQHVGMHVKNMEETIAWYHDVLGFELEPSKSEMPGIFPKCKVLRLGGFFLELYEVMNAEPFTFTQLEYTLGPKHLSFYVEDLDGLMDYIEERGDIEVVVDNRYSPNWCHIPEGDRAVYILDNNGLLVELQKHERK